MMNVRVLFFGCICFFWLSGMKAQTNRKIRNLQAQRTALQKQITESERVLRTMKKDVKSQMNDLAVLNGQIARQQEYVNTIEEDVKILDKEIATTEKELDFLQTNLQDAKEKYTKSVQYSYLKNHSIQDKLMFIFSAETMKQMLRRVRYAKEYTTYVKVQGEKVKEKQRQVLQKKSDLLAVKGEKSNLLRQVEEERKKLENKKEEQRKLLADLQKKQKNVQKEISQKQKEADKLNAQIDRLVELEIAAAKKREEERRKKELARKEAARKKTEAKSGRTIAKTGRKADSPTSSKSNIARSTRAEGLSASNTRTEKMSGYKVDDEDRLVSGGFARNKGLLPIPITGPYVIVGHYGVHGVAGLKNVQLNNNGIDIKGQSGAQARAIFQGEVSNIFSYRGMHGVLVRHGSYISVYCNLASVCVRTGQKLKARDIIGKVANNGDGNYILQFQLRKETTKLNPEQWLSRR